MQFRLRDPHQSCRTYKKRMRAVASLIFDAHTTRLKRTTLDPHKNDANRWFDFGCSHQPTHTHNSTKRRRMTVQFLMPAVRNHVCAKNTDGGSPHAAPFGERSLLSSSTGEPSRNPPIKPMTNGAKAEMAKSTAWRLIMC